MAALVEPANARNEAMRSSILGRGGIPFSPDRGLHTSNVCTDALHRHALEFYYYYVGGTSAVTNKPYLYLSGLNFTPRNEEFITGVSTSIYVCVSVGIRLMHVRTFTQ